MAAKVCPDCGRSFPVTIDFNDCPECEVATQTRSMRSPSVSAADLRRYLFEAHYRKREEARIARGEPSPEELGRAEARHLLALEVALTLPACEGMG